MNISIRQQRFGSLIKRLNRMRAGMNKDIREQCEKILARREQNERN